MIKLITLFHFAFVYLFYDKKLYWIVDATKPNDFDLIHYDHIRLKRNSNYAISCPRDTYPFTVHGKVKECQPNNSTDSCPEGFICYFDNFDGRYICCGKTTGYCEGGKPYFDPNTNKPQRCTSTTRNVCRRPYECVINDKTNDGYCCLNMSKIEPPPVGCPWGTRPLRDVNKQLVPCTPGMANACPGKAICYFDSLERTNRCCGRDPGEGCPSGTRAFKINNQIVQCLPGDPQQTCPDKSICQWSYLIDRFQCCEADDGCPSDTNPYYEPGSTRTIRACIPLNQQPSSLTQANCPTDYTCEFNFWTISYQCCGKKSGLCPPNQVAFVDINTGMAQSCAIGQPSFTCPLGYTCQISNTGQGLCCGQPGQCPSGTSPYKDSSGRLNSCSPTIPNSCLQPSTCQAAIGGLPGQFLCCIMAGVTGQCPLGYSMQNNQIVPCNPASPTVCAPGASCLPSLSQPATFLCCQFDGDVTRNTDGAQCPSGYRIQAGLAQMCSPTVPASCPVGSQCMQSPSRPSTFYCCTPVGIEASQCPPSYTLQDGILTQCSPSMPTCKLQSACLQSPSNPSLFICCTHSFLPTSPCPSGFYPQNNIVTSCSPSIPTACRIGASCLPSLLTPGVYICCVVSGTESPSPQCPSGFAMQNNQIVSCDPSTLLPCHSNNFCLSATGGTSMNYICCYPVERSLPVTNFMQCPVNYVYQDGVPIQCNPQNPTVRCSPAASCLGSLDQPAVTICCVPSTPSSGQCPSGYSLQNNAVTQCSLSFPTCVSESRCMASTVNPNFFLCCTPLSGGDIPSCPLGFSHASTAPQICTPNAESSTCPSNSQCMQSQNQPNVNICCLAGGVSGQFQCPGNGQPYKSDSTFMYCTLGTMTCPSGYACQPAINAPGIAICCTTSSIAPNCPNGASAVPMTGQPGHYIFCTLTNSTCPVGSSCQTTTNMVNTYVCCSALGTSTAYACPHDYTPLVDPTGLVTFCSAGGDFCPTPSKCLEAANNPQFFICCQPFGQSAAQCPSPGSTPLYVAGIVQTCAGPSSACPQIGYTCQESSTNRQYICCSTGPPGGVQCANGQQVYQPGPITFFCNPNLGQCPDQYDCLSSTLPGQHVCCSRVGTALQCVSGRQPYPNPQNPQICSPQSTTCPVGTSCELSTMGNQYICCASTGAMSKCPAGAQAFLEGLVPRRCTGPSDLSCPQPFTCAPSDQPNVYICCQFGTDGSLRGGPMRCFSGASAYIPPGSTQPQTCTVSAQNCPPGFSCQASSTPGVTVCCGAVNQNALLCPDGSPSLIQGTQPIICSDLGVSCPPTFACLPTPTSPGSRVCCASSGSEITDVGPQVRSDVCGPGQQPYFINNQPQTCQVGAPKICTDGYICQQGPTGIYYCCQGPRCSNGVTLLETNGQPRFCNPASASCPIGSHCQQAINLPGTFICCMTSPSQSPTLARCIGRNTYLSSTGRPQMCNAMDPTSCPFGTECSSFTTTNDMICCSQLAPSDTGLSSVCPQGDPYRDPITKQYHYCSSTNYACPDGFVCKRTIHDSARYVCCSAKTTCQKSWIPYMNPITNLPSQCSPFDINACKPPGPPYKCQQSTKPGEYLCCMEMTTIMHDINIHNLEYENETIYYEHWTTSSTRPGPVWKTGNG